MVRIKSYAAQISYRGYMVRIKSYAAQISYRGYMVRIKSYAAQISYRGYMVRIKSYAAQISYRGYMVRIKSYAAQNDDALSYISVRGLYFLAVVFVTMMMMLYVKIISFSLPKVFNIKLLILFFRCDPYITLELT